MAKSLFPYKPRPNQREFMSLVRRALSEQSHIVVESGTGSGKTVCALVPCVEHALKRHKKVLYLTRTNSQQRQVIRESRAIAKKGKFFACGVQGRHNTCLKLESDPEFREGSPDELAKWCGELKQRVLKGKPNGCPHYAKLVELDKDALVGWAKEALPTVEEFAARCRSLGVCPYEANKLLVPEALVITAPYVYFFTPQILKTLLTWMGTVAEDVIIVIDEAHNLPEYARELRSAELSTWTLNAAAKEAEKFGDAEIISGTSVADFCRLAEETLRYIAAQYVIDEDGLVPHDELESALMNALKVTDYKLRTAFENLVEYGEMVSESRRKDGRLPRSYVRAVGSFMLFWQALDSDEHVKLAYGGENPRLEAYAMDPSGATEAILNAHASLHMSGTLAPMEEYRDSVGLPRDTPLARFPSPFPRENRLVLYTPDVTTRFEDFSRDGEILARMNGYMERVLAGERRNAMAFFPSFNVMSYFASLRDGRGRAPFSERRGMPQQELMGEVQQFKLADGGLMFAVEGGRLSEGIDFPGRELEIAFLVGVPYPKPSAKQKALLRYYDSKFGKGWEYTVKAPTARKMLQSIGRLIRNETDRGVAIILDKRAIQFSEYLDGLRESADLASEVSAFFANPKE
jgi:DNA excision repair protein ERCC-2